MDCSKFNQEQIIEKWEINCLWRASNSLLIIITKALLSFAISYLPTNVALFRFVYGKISPKRRRVENYGNLDSTVSKCVSCTSFSVIDGSIFQDRVPSDRIFHRVCSKELFGSWHSFVKKCFV